MRVLVRLLVVLIAFIYVQARGVRFSKFESRRPIKYFFHLLELKSDYNPLLYPIVASNKACSSKIGPFCQITGHSPLKTHELREEPLEIQTIKGQLTSNMKYAYQTYQTVQRSGNQMFLIRNSLTNMYENHIKKQMGQMNKEEMLSPTKFKTIFQQ